MQKLIITVFKNVEGIIRFAFVSSELNHEGVLVLRIG